MHGVKGAGRGESGVFQANAAQLHAFRSFGTSATFALAQGEEQEFFALGVLHRTSGKREVAVGNAFRIIDGACGGFLQGLLQAAALCRIHGNQVDCRRLSAGGNECIFSVEFVMAESLEEILDGRGVPKGALCAGGSVCVDFPSPWPSS